MKFIYREDNSIEIWNVSFTPHIEMTIFGTFGTIEGLAWYNKRLFSVGLQGSVIEYDLRKHEPKVIQFFIVYKLFSENYNGGGSVNKC